MALAVSSISLKATGGDEAANATPPVPAPFKTRRQSQTITCRKRPSAERQRARKQHMSAVYSARTFQHHWLSERATFIKLLSWVRAHFRPSVGPFVLHGSVRACLGPSGSVSPVPLSLWSADINFHNFHDNLILSKPAKRQRRQPSVRPFDETPGQLQQQRQAITDRQQSPLGDAAKAGTPPSTTPRPRCHGNGRQSRGESWMDGRPRIEENNRGRFDGINYRRLL